MADPWAFGWDQVFSALNAVAVLAAAVAGVWGVRTWRVERHDTRQAEIAEELLSLMYEGQSVIAQIRNPFSYAGEGSSRPRDPSRTETLEESILRDGKYIPFERIERHENFFDRVIELKPRVRAYFGNSMIAHLDALLQARGKVLVAARAEAREAGVGVARQFRTERELQTWLQRQERRDAALWEDPDEDEISANITHHISCAEKLTLPIIRTTGKERRSWLSGTLLERTPRRTD